MTAGGLQAKGRILVFLPLRMMQPGDHAVPTTTSLSLMKKGTFLKDR